MVPSKWGTPLFKHPDQPALLDVLQRHVFGNPGETVSTKAGRQDGGTAVEGQLAFNPHIDLATAFLELPCVQAAMCWKP